MGRSLAEGLGIRQPFATAVDHLEQGSQAETGTKESLSVAHGSEFFNLDLRQKIENK